MTYISDSGLDRLKSVMDLPDLRGTKYTIVERIARGGMGTIFLAEDAELKRRVALKVLTLPDPTGAMVARMKAEARTVARLEHPSIIPIHDAGRLPDGRVFYAMKYVRGTTLTEWLTGRPPLGTRVRLIRQVCEAIAFAHSQGIIHRDIKPDNIMVGAFGEVLVMDWGVAKVIRSGNEAPDPPEPGCEPDFSSDSGHRHARGSGGGAADTVSGETLDCATSRGSIVGTPAFMSPEQASGDSDAVDEKTDVYMLGATLFYALTGRVPFDAPNPKELLGKIMAGSLPSMRRLNPDIPAPLAAVCLKAIAREKARRYQSASEFSDDLGRFLEQEPVTAFPENLARKAARWLRKNQFIVLLLLTYLILRAITFYFLKR